MFNGIGGHPSRERAGSENPRSPNAMAMLDNRKGQLGQDWVVPGY